MSSPLPLLPPTALDYFASLVADDAGLPLFEAAAAIAQCEEPSLDTQAAVDQVDTLAARLASRLAADAGPLQKLRLLNHFYFQELGFAGNVNDYYDPRNSYVHAVLETRRGIPVTLAVIYLELAAAIGLEAHGIAFPGHYLVKVRLPQGEVVLDPFTGQSLSRDALDGMLAPHRRGKSGRREIPLSSFLRPASARETLARMLRNLKEIFGTRQDATRALAVSERLVLLLPEAWDERRDRGLLHAQLGARRPAMLDLAGYLEHRPDAADRLDIARRLAELAEPGDDGRYRLH